MFKFEKLDAWKKAISYANTLIEVSRKLPKDYRYTFCPQLIRAALSIPNNIAEATGRTSALERKNFYNIAKGSAYETVTMTFMLKQQNLISVELFERLYFEGDEISRMLTGLMKACASNSNSKLETKHAVHAGFTLIEVLIASAIFVSVLIIGISSFTTTNRIQEEINEIRETTQTANFVTETISRDIRGATGLRNINGQFDPSNGFPYPFEILSDNLLPQRSEYPSSTKGLRTVRFDTVNNNRIETTYTLVSSGSGSDIEVTKTVKTADGLSTVSEESGNILPEGFSIENFRVEGPTHASAAFSSNITQPFVLLSMDIVNTLVDPPFVQNVRTLVTSQEFF